MPFFLTTCYIIFFSLIAHVCFVTDYKQLYLSTLLLFLPMRLNRSTITHEHLTKVTGDGGIWSDARKLVIWDRSLENAARSSCWVSEDGAYPCGAVALTCF